MKFNKCLLALSFALSAAFTGQAGAATIDTVIPPSDLLLNNGTPSRTYTHDLSDHGFSLGTTIYTYGKLIVRLTDMTQDEAGSITVGGAVTATGNIANDTRDHATAGTLFEIILNSVALADLNADGQLSVLIERSAGNFYFADSTLTLEGRQAYVPEPLSIALLGAGAVGFCLSRRRARKA